VREDAENTFFAQNQWYLTLKLARESIPDDSPGPYTSRKRFLRGEVVGTDTAAFIKETWGEQALSRMQNVRLYIQGGDSVIHETVKRNLKDLVRIFQRGNLRQFSVEWLNHYSLENLRGPCGTPRIKERSRIRVCSRKEDGTRGDSVKSRSWPKEEQILEPLKELRHLQQAVVFGCVTDQWALSLEQYMMSGEAIVPEFERREDAPDVIVKCEEEDTARDRRYYHSKYLKEL
jgi:hypothetical protein